MAKNKNLINKEFLFIYILLSILLLANIGQLIYIIKFNKKEKAEAAIVNAVHVQQDQLSEWANNNQALFSSIQNYLDGISSSYIEDEKNLSAQYNVPSWGCGPSSYALAKIINAKFFNNQLPIGAAYNQKMPDEIIERFGFYKDNTTSIVDHAWLEIYLGDKFLFVDPSIGQFGKFNQIVYQQFDVTDSNIGAELQNKYGIQDVRMSILLQKALNRIPADQEPYPGYQISQQALNYYIHAVDDRNSVDANQTPDDWTVWVDYLIGKYA